MIMAHAAAIAMRRFEVRRQARVHERVPFTAEVRYFDWDHARTAPARELSAGGVFLCTGSPLSEGRLVTLRIELRGVDEAFTVLARVVRTVRGSALRDSGMGLEFIDISSQHRALVRQYVAARSEPAAS
jgi:c-di-GMP-binding flagellar brake protein YcgR